MSAKAKGAAMPIRAKAQSAFIEFKTADGQPPTIEDFKKKFIQAVDGFVNTSGYFSSLDLITYNY